jgi:hypothetical protein
LSWVGDDSSVVDFGHLWQTFYRSTFVVWLGNYGVERHGLGEEMYPLLSVVVVMSVIRSGGS